MEQRPTRSEAEYDSTYGTPEAEPRAEDQRGIAALLKRLANESSALVRGEVALAKAEMNEKIKQAERGVVAAAIGGGVVYAGVLVLLAAAVLSMSLVMPAWIAALIVGGGAALIGVGMLLAGRAQLKVKRLTPRRTIDEGRATTRMLKEQWQ